MIHHIEANQVIDEVLNGSDKVVIVDFFATWCVPCQMQTPILEELSKSCEDVEVYKVNIDDNQELAIRYGISSVPTIVFFKDGEEVERCVGLTEIEEINEIVDNLKE